MINKKIYNTLPVFKKSNKKYQFGGMSEEEARKIRDKAKEIKDIEAKRMKDESRKKAMIPASNDSSITSSTSSTTPVSATPTSKKTVVRLDNDYYEVNVDADGKPVFNTKNQLNDTQKKSYSDKYYFAESPATATSVPTLAVPASVTVAPKIANTGIARENKPPVKKVAQESKPKGSREVMALQKKLNDTYGANISVDGLIGNQTREAFYNANLSEEERQKYLSANPKLNKTAAFGIPSYLTYLPSISETAPAAPVKPKTTAKADTSKTATDTSRVSAILSNNLGIKSDTSATWQKPASKKVISAPFTPPSMNKGADSNGGIIQAQRQVEEGVKRNIQPRGLTGYEKIDRFQDDVSALSTAASLTGVGGLPAKVVDIADATLDAGQFAYAAATGNKPEMLNQGMQTGMRIVLPLAARGAGKAIKTLAPGAEEIGYRIGNNKVKAPLWNKSKTVYGKAKETIGKKVKPTDNTWEEYNEATTPTLSYNQRKGVSLLEPIGEKPYVPLEVNPVLQKKAVDAKKTISEIGDPTKATPEQKIKLKKAEETIKECKDHQDLIIKTNAKKRAEIAADGQLSPLVEKIPETQMKKVMEEIESEVTFRPRVNMAKPLTQITANEIVKKPGKYSHEAYKKAYDFLKELADKDGHKMEVMLPPVKTAMELPATVPVPKSMSSTPITTRPIPIGGKLPKYKTDGLGTDWEWTNPNVGKLIEEQEALLAKAKTLAEIKPIEEKLKKLYESKVTKIDKTPELSKPVRLKKPTEMNMKEAEDIMINAENYPASYVKEIEKHLTETKSKLRLNYRAPKKQFGGYRFI